MSMPAAKRQRTDAASYALSKPFRSPMKTSSMAIKNKASALEPQNSPNTAQSGAEDTTKALESTRLLLLQPAATPSSTKASKKQLSSSISSKLLNEDPDIVVLTKAQCQLEKQLRELKEELHTAEQAGRIEVDSEKKTSGGAVDGELMQLIVKWRAASRQAAEELFTGVRDRVNRMGGPKAWKEMQERQKVFRNGWDTEPLPQIDSDDEDGQDVERRDLYAEYDVETETANEKEARGGNEILEDEGAEDEFTMAMMLRSLNVPLETIGYDRENQRWAE